MTKHWLHVEPDQPYLDRFGHLGYDPEDPPLTYRLECADPKACPAWIECDQEHPDAPDPDEEYEGVVMHGVEHEYRWGSGWTVDYPRCAAASTFLDGDSHLVIARELGTGRHEVSVEWVEVDSINLTPVEVKAG